ncbi:hypothetical protein JR338_00825 [Chloroflexota bacterium]|nr:hypothetical protein JR338_00825 [Chloroflexota bacterium]
MKPSNRSKLIIISTLLALILASCNLPSRAAVQIAITSHENGQAVVLSQEARIVSVATSSRGISSVELYISGVLLETAEPPDGTPKEFTANQAYTPTEEGNVIITVVAYDTKGNHSEPVSISLTVVQSLEGVDETIETVEPPTPTITLTPQGLDQTQTASVGCTNGASFVSDVTIPDNTVMTAGSNFTKIWRVTNTGSCDWVSYQLVHASNDLLGASSPQAIPLVNAGSNGDLSVDMTAPASPGTYTSSWRIRGSDGSIFGPTLTVIIVIPENATNTPNPTATATVTPTATTGPVSVSQHYEGLSISAGATVHTTVNCPAGSVVVSGGYAANDGVRVWHSTKDGNGWRVYATNTTGSNKAVNVYAVCLHNSGGTTDVEYTQKYINASTYTQIVANCPSGSVVTGGGWVIGSDANVSLYNSTKSGNGWQIYVQNDGGGTPLVNVYAVCLADTSGTTTSVSNTTGVIPPGDIEHLVMDCPSGSYVTGGGFAVNTGAVIYNETITGNAWQVYARNNTGTQKLLFGYGICYSP